MGIIREPDHIDFVFDPTPPTKEELKLISEFIRESKEKNGVVTWEGVITKNKDVIPEINSTGKRRKSSIEATPVKTQRKTA